MITTKRRRLPIPMASEVMAPYNIPENQNAELPSISITPSRRVSISTPIRFTRTFSTDSLDSLERNGRVELRRLRIMDDDETELGQSPLQHQSTLYPAVCPHLGTMGRSVTEPQQAPRKSLTRAPRSVGDLTRETPSPSRKTLADQIGLTNYQLRVIQQSWPNIYGTGGHGPFASSIYSKLTARNANARQLLAKANGVAVFQNEADTTAVHARTTLELIDTAIKALEQDYSIISESLIQVGRSHRHLKSEGLNANVWDELGDSILDSLRRFDSVRKHKELRRAWLALVAYLIDNIKQGQSMARVASSYELSNHSTPTKKLTK